MKCVARYSTEVNLVDYTRRILCRRHDPFSQFIQQAEVSEFRNQSWFRKFANAFRGVRIVVLTQKSFWIHVPVAILVFVLAWWLQVSRMEWIILGACVTIVLAAEMLNTAIEFLSRRVTDEVSESVRDSLDAAAGGVLVASIGSAIIGLVILVPKLLATMEIGF